MKYHPDKNKDPTAEETFRNIAEAYDILGNADKRRQYDAQDHHSFKSSSSHDGFHFNMHDFFKEFDAASAEFHNSQHQAHHDIHKKMHDRAHAKAHKKATASAFGFDIGSLFDDDEAHLDFDGIFGDFKSVFNHGDNNIHVDTKTHTETVHQSCRTVTRREGKTVSTITECT